MKFFIGLITMFLSLSSFAANYGATGLSKMDCANDAIEQTEKLLRFHWQAAPNEEIPNHTKSTLQDVSPMELEKLADSNKSFDVLKVQTYVYKASYTAILTYAKIPDMQNPNGIACVLMGQSIRDNSNPY